ncbi:MAG: radical SAM protein [Candidatus Humimicrobiaceae bacterium]
MALGNVNRDNFKNIFLPPSLLFKQLESVLFFRSTIRWRGFGKWLTRKSLRSIPVSAGAVGMGCIGFPNHPVWEVTNRCNLNCIHCHTEGGHKLDDELDTSSAKRLIDELAEIKEFRMLVYTGGEPFMREDLFELLEHSKKAGFVNVIASNGMMIDDEIAKDLKRNGVAGVAVSLDSDNCLVHNNIRNNPKAFEKALRGIEAIKKAGILLQINTTAMDINFEDLGDLIDYVDKLGSGIMLMYQLVPVGRGIEIAKSALDMDYNEKLLTFLAEKQKKSSVLIEPVAGPQYWAYLLERAGRTSRFWIKMAERSFYGCAAGNGLVYIKANGDVWPCPFIEVNAGNIRNSSFRKIWEDSEVFNNLRNRSEKLNGKVCSDCKYNIICGGCRGRAMAYNSDYMGDDPSCFIHDNDKV